MLQQSGSSDESNSMKRTTKELPLVYDVDDEEEEDARIRLMYTLFHCFSTELF